MAIQAVQHPPLSPCLLSKVCLEKPELCHIGCASLCPPAHVGAVPFAAPQGYWGSRCAAGCAGPWPTMGMGEAWRGRGPSPGGPQPVVPTPEGVQGTAERGCPCPGAEGSSPRPFWLGGGSPRPCSFLVLRLLPRGWGCSAGLCDRCLEQKAAPPAPGAAPLRATIRHRFSLIDCKKQFTQHKLLPTPSSVCPGIA